MEELTAGNFVAETKEAILVGRIAPPSGHIGGYVGWHLEAECGKAGTDQGGSGGTARPARDLSGGVASSAGLEETGDAITISKAGCGGESKSEK